MGDFLCLDGIFFEEFLRKLGYLPCWFLLFLVSLLIWRNDQKEIPTVFKLKRWVGTVQAAF
jgi:hypothetical protein